MNTNTKYLKLFIFLFLLNSITLILYFTSHPDLFHRRHHHHRQPPSTTTHTHLLNLTNKPWPILPSYLPWHLTPNTPFRSCEAYFGHGFTRRIDILKPTPDSPGKEIIDQTQHGWFRCFYSETLRSSVCEGGRVRMHPEKIKMSSGGEELESVIGRSEDEELPEFEFGAFDIEVGAKARGRKMASEGFLNEFVQRRAIERHTMRDLINSVRLVGADEFQCSEWIEEPTLLITRFEYANLFHTITDWYSAYVSSRVTGLPNRPQLVFVDGHCMTQLEETWKAVFSGLRYAKNFSGPVCFRHAILSPLGYETAMFRGLSENIDCYGASAHDLWQKPDNKKTARISEFGEMIRSAFSLPLHPQHHASKSGPRYHNVLFVRREDYLAHPRHAGKVQSRLSNEQEVFDSLKNWSTNHTECKVNLVNGLFGHMSMKEQVRAIQDASVIVGAHGAGLTHIVSATPETEILEIVSSEYRRPHFELISKWKGLKYHPIYLGGSHASPSVVIGKLRDILKNIGC
ncbi:beta-1,2-xylosyltransferase-like [Bidens hawaiensis]|uniref:beta-1,2-xylosyltransferase-like n=1 Tax=Bidens hawaiensis TaxID=980011 RepID=UPI004049545B